MERHLLIALSGHSEREDFGVFLSVLLMSCHGVGDYSPEVSKPK